MVHGDCSSRGCYAMTDEQIAEIYSLGRESFFGGQRTFQIQAYPFRMTPLNMAKHRNNPNMPFWRMIKEGNDHFEVTNRNPRSISARRNMCSMPAKPPNATHDPVFEASAKCPAYVIPDELADAVRQKQRADDAEMARLVAKGTPVARMNTGIDGGMNKVFAAKLPNGDTGLSDGGEGQSLSLLALARAPAPFPPTSIRRHSPSEGLLAGAPEEPKIAAPATAPRARFRAAAPAPAAPRRAPPRSPRNRSRSCPSR